MYEVILTRKALKAYHQANTSFVTKLNRCLENLSKSPYQHPNIKSLKGKLIGRFRYRVGVLSSYLSNRRSEKGSNCLINRDSWRSISKIVLSKCDRLNHLIKSLYDNACSHISGKLIYYGLENSRSFILEWGHF